MKNNINSLYIHFPFCKSICNYCDFYKKPIQEGENYTSFHQLLEKSFTEQHHLLEKYSVSYAPLKSLYLGGGTPSLWGIEGAKTLHKMFKEHDIEFDQNYEATMEVNPDSYNQEIINAWKDFGINRFSLGIQSLDSRYSKVLDRAHSVDDAINAIRFFHKKKENFSVDLMLGLPFSKEWNRDVLRELKEILKYRPDHFSVYILTVKGDYPYLKDLPSEEWIEKEYFAVSDYLRSEGYDHYEVSNFALKDKRSFHNKQYWKSASVAALGPSATGFLNLGDRALRYKWKPTGAEYITEELNHEQMRLEEVYLKLRTEDGVELEEAWSAIVKSWVEKGYAELHSQKHFRLTSRGYLVLDSLMDELFRENAL